jgi:hypothetical protein
MDVLRVPSLALGGKGTRMTCVRYCPPRQNTTADVITLHMTRWINWNWIQTTVSTSMPARFLIRAVPRSLRTALSDRRDVTATLVVTRILLSADVVCGAVHSEIYSSHSELELFSNRLQICQIIRFNLSRNSNCRHKRTT